MAHPKNAKPQQNQNGNHRPPANESWETQDHLLRQVREKLALQDDKTVTELVKETSQRMKAKRSDMNCPSK